MSIMSPVLNAMSWVEEHSIPASISENPEAENQARMFLVSHFFGPFLGLSAPIALWAVDPTPGADILILALSILGFWLFPFMMRAGLPYRWLVRLSVTDLYFAIFWSLFHYGGTHSPTITWVLIIPILIVFYVGGNLRRHYDLALITLGCCITFVLAIAYLSPAPNDIPTTAMKVLGAISTIAVMCYISFMAIYYARIFDAGVDLEKEVTSRRQMEKMLRAATERANDSSRAKSDFLAKMSHELRSPLNAIIGYSEMLREDEVEKTKDTDAPAANPFLVDVDRILEAGRYLTRLIEQILDLAKIESGKMTLDARKWNVPELVEDVVENHRAAISEKGLVISLDISPDVECARIDAKRFVQIVNCLVDNAVAFTQEGEITVQVEPSMKLDCPGFKVVVTDTGSGIAPELLGSIFDSFEMKRDAADSRYGGTGLALSVASKLCDAMGGTISVTSQVGQGSSFSVTFPRQA